MAYQQNRIKGIVRPRAKVSQNRSAFRHSEKISPFFVIPAEAGIQSVYPAAHRMTFFLCAFVLALWIPAFSLRATRFGETGRGDDERDRKAQAFRHSAPPFFYPEC